MSQLDSALPTRPRSLRTLVALASAAAVLSVPVLAAPASAHPAPAAPAVAQAAGTTVGQAAIAEAARHKGKPYRYGAAGPSAFDCSGYVGYVFSRVGVKLPRTSAQIYAAAAKVAKGQQQVGDLIFMRSGGRISHVGIYAGNGTFWVARRTGTTITQQKIWTSDYLVGRVA